jgi:hypothetical protein
VTAMSKVVAGISMSTGVRRSVAKGRDLGVHLTYRID